MCLYLKANKVNARGIISEAEDWGIRVCIPSFDFKGIIRFKDIAKLSVTSTEDDNEGKKSINLRYKGKGEVKFILK